MLPSVGTRTHRLMEKGRSESSLPSELEIKKRPGSSVTAEPIFPEFSGSTTQGLDQVADRVDSVAGSVAGSKSA